MALKPFVRFRATNTLMGVLLVVIALITLFVSSILKYNQMREMVMNHAYSRAQENIDRVDQDFTLVAELVESAIRNNIWSARVLTTQPDSLWNLVRGIVEDNPEIYGSSVALVENYNPRKSGRLFAPYAHRDGSQIVTVQLGTEEYDYLSHEWFTEAVKRDGKEGFWSEPYYDEGGGNKLMTTYSIAIRDHQNKLAAVVTADVDLDWMGDRLEAIVDYPYALKILVSHKGTIMATSPPNVGMTRRSIVDVAAQMEDGKDFEEVNRAMLAGEEGSQKVRLQGKKYHVFYDTIRKTGWSMSITIPEEEIFADLKAMNRQSFGIQMLGILMLILIFIVTVRNQRKMVEIKEDQSRTDSELKIASEIQSAMVPKEFPPFQGRKDIDLFASITPAKEVGGDLYDYFIRDERLYFCIGDVSGKGVPASLVMSVTRSLFRTVSGHEKSPQHIVVTMNRNLVEMNVNDMFVTFFCGVLDLRTGHLRYCNAGHNAPVLITPASSALLPVSPNVPLGVLGDVLYDEQETDLAAGQGIFLYTDGLNEAENANAEQFGMERVMATLNPQIDATQQVNAMLEAVNIFVGNAPQSDDLTLLYIRYMNENPEPVIERHLMLRNDVQQIQLLEGLMSNVAELAHLDAALTMNLNLAVEEAVTNVIMYAYPPGTEGLVDIEVIIRRDQLMFRIIDGGKPFDPTAAPEADITLDVEDRPIGGLGIFLVRQIMDDVRYERVNARNILSMSKNLQ